MKSGSLEILVAVVLFLCACPAFGVIEFKDGLTHNIDYRIRDDVWIDYESPGLGTTVNILDKADISYHNLVKGWEDSIINIFGGTMGKLNPYDSSRVTVSGGSIRDYLGGYDSSQVTVSGGSINWLSAHDNSQFTVSGGSVNRLVAWDSSQLTVSGGTVDDDLRAFDSSQVTVSGGSINHLTARGNSQLTVSGVSMDKLQAYESSQVTVSGGSMDHLWPYGSSQVTVSGGSMNHLRAYESSQVTVSGGLFGGELLVWDNAVLTIHGWDFAVDGMSVGYTELASIFGGDFRDEPYRQLKGTLLSGDPINNQFRIGNSAKIVLVPEPATILLLGLGGVALLRKRRPAAVERR